MKKGVKALLILLGITVVLILGLMALVYIPSPEFEPVAHEPIRPEYWPTHGWRTSTPEEQGMDSEKLMELIEFYNERRGGDERIRIDSFTLIRNGFIVADFYLNPLYPRNTTHILHSCTKSIVSALIGIAIMKGYLQSVDVPVYDIFKDHGYEVSDERMKNVTVKHLLAMQTGVRSQDDLPYKYRGLFKVQHTENWVEAFLNLPMDTEPGRRFDYSNLASFMLSAIIHKTTGMDTLSFAKKHLFTPLGIKDIQWETDPQGIYIGWARMWLKPEDMAKFGLLYLQQGRWEDRQIIPKEWVMASITPHSYPKNYKDILDENGEKDQQASGGNWVGTKFLKPFQDGYGYQFWLDRSGSFAAMGTSGQFIIVVPEKNMIVVATSKLTGLDTFLPAKIVDEFVLPAIASDNAIIPDQEAQNQLALLSGPPEQRYNAKSVPELPNMSRTISGATYEMETNAWNYNNFQLRFNPAEDYAQFNYTAKLGEAVNMKIGLDNVPRMAKTNNHIYAAKGHWSAPDTFTIYVEVIGYSTQDQWHLIFTQSGITVKEVNEITGIRTYTGTRK